MNCIVKPEMKGTKPKHGLPSTYHLEIFQLKRIEVLIYTSPLLTTFFVVIYLLCC